MDFKEMGWENMSWSDLTEVRWRWRAVLNVVMNFWVPKKCGGFLI